MQTGMTPFKLRPLVESDKLFFYKLYKDPQVMRYIDDIKTDAEIWALIDSFPLDWNIEGKRHFCGVIEDEISHQLLGAFVITFKEENNQRVAFMQGILSPTSQLKGIMTHGVKLLLRLPELSSVRIFRAIVTKGNIASEKVLLKSGFSHVKTLENNCKINGVSYDDVFYELVR